MKGRRLLALRKSLLDVACCSCWPCPGSMGLASIGNNFVGTLSLSHLRSLLLLLLFFACQMSAPTETLGFCAGTECIHTVHSKRVCLLLYSLEIVYIWKGRHRTIREEKRSANFLLCRRRFQVCPDVLCVCVCVLCTTWIHWRIWIRGRHTHTTRYSKMKCVLLLCRVENMYQVVVLPRRPKCWSCMCWGT
jgi:hypothetical protein